MLGLSSPLKSVVTAVVYTAKKKISFLQTVHVTLTPPSPRLWKIRPWFCLSSKFFVHLLLAGLTDQYCFAGWRMSSVTLPAGGPTGRVGGWVPSQHMHGGPVRLCPVMATPCLLCSVKMDYDFVHCTGMAVICGKLTGLLICMLFVWAG